MQRLFDIPASAAYAERCACLQQAGIALWDVCHAACRPGSLDSAIVAETIIANDIQGLLHRAPGIERIAFNGQAAAKLFKRHVPAFETPTLITLPSTSPAHASLNLEQKLAQWAVITR